METGKKVLLLSLQFLVTASSTWLLFSDFYLQVLEHLSLSFISNAGPVPLAYWSASAIIEFPSMSGARKKEN